MVKELHLLFSSLFFNFWNTLFIVELILYFVLYAGQSTNILSMVKEAHINFSQAFGIPCPLFTFLYFDLYAG